MPKPDGRAIDIPAAWEELPLEDLRGTLLVIGAPDTGKSTFARYLYRRLWGIGRRGAFLDGDPGQSHLGPPTTITMAVDAARGGHFPPHGPRWRYFVGSTTPRGHLVPVLVGVSRLVEMAYAARAQVIVCDTSGFVDEATGGLMLALAKIELLQPSAVFALARGQELDALTAPLRHWRHLRLFHLHPSRAVQPRDLATRQAARAARFAAFFHGARPQEVNWAKLAVLPAPRFDTHRLVALQNHDGSVLSLGIVLAEYAAAPLITVLAPTISHQDIQTLRIGDTLVDPLTFRDQTAMLGYR
jgi:polynucleotide 5'-hydroxyl-kinase GRC3/NOL9